MTLKAEGLWGITARVLCTQKHNIFLQNTVILVANVLTYYWPTYWIYHQSNYSSNLLLVNMQMMAYPSDSARPVQCSIIVLLSSLALEAFCSSCQLSNSQLWDLKSISYQAQRRKWLKMRHFPHSRCLFLSIYAGNFFFPRESNNSKEALWVCVARISQRTDAATPSAVREAAVM